jgi:hypothetical protein
VDDREMHLPLEPSYLLLAHVRQRQPIGKSPIDVRIGGAGVQKKIERSGTVDADRNYNEELLGRPESNPDGVLVR